MVRLAWSASCGPAFVVPNPVRDGSSRSFWAERHSVHVGQRGFRSRAPHTPGRVAWLQPTRGWSTWRTVRTFRTGLNAASPRAGASGPGRAGHAAWRPFRARPVPSAAGRRQQRPGPVPGRCSQLGRASPSTALWTAEAGACLAAVSPSPHRPAGRAVQTRWAESRTGIAAGHLGAAWIGVTAQIRVVGTVRPPQPSFWPPHWGRNSRNSNETATRPMVVKVQVSEPKHE